MQNFRIKHLGSARRDLHAKQLGGGSFEFQSETSFYIKVRTIESICERAGGEHALYTF